LRLLLCSYYAVTGVRVTHAQDLQLHYDWRHAFDARNNPRNFPSLAFKNFKALDFGSFLLKVQAGLDGNQHNLSKVYFEGSQTLRFWKPSIFVHVEYTGGLGLSTISRGPKTCSVFPSRRYSVGCWPTGCFLIHRRSA
jgi:hypothetical protein